MTQEVFDSTIDLLPHVRVFQQGMPFAGQGFSEFFRDWKPPKDMEKYLGALTEDGLTELKEDIFGDQSKWKSSDIVSRRSVFCNAYSQFFGIPLKKIPAIGVASRLPTTSCL